ncbi:MAG: hypothetical protein HYI21_07305 [Sediminibacterium sp. Gen4]|jgi:hypothetical protein|uniref:hypothetical protein n=1 Tax=unclassified Sediminibacterium TaxID=2635961 RepID=UPI0015C06C62|nr:MULTISPECIES: hypothetical protein [unclassified Sediminibacterium]MBW0160644.1 hypothetical protein [Sediminibacterium sp.]MBW0163459.1 hypothetical protein [Sediminibacterium sp.]NWK65815.1 hypothetical protein [Sediminibacterium sp. Gen4]
MKQLFVFISLLLAFGRLAAQSQELETLKVEMQKLAQLKLMLSEMKNGYQSLAKGYDALRDIGKTNFQLHQQQLDKLLLVSPELQRDPVIRQIQVSHQQIQTTCVSLLQEFRKTQLFRPDEIFQLDGQCKRIIHSCEADMEVLSRVLSPGKFRMSDGERKEVINSIRQSMETNMLKLDSLRMNYLRTFSERQQKVRDIQSLKRLNKIQ